MPIISFDYSGVTSRFRILVNGFADGRSFASIREARDSIAALNADDLSVEIFDAHAKRYVWARRVEAGFSTPRTAGRLFRSHR